MCLALTQEHFLIRENMVRVENYMHSTYSSRMKMYVCFDFQRLEGPVENLIMYLGMCRDSLTDPLHVPEHAFSNKYRKLNLYEENWGASQDAVLFIEAVNVQVPTAYMLYGLCIFQGT